MSPSTRGLAANPALPAPLLDHLVATADEETGPVLAGHPGLTAAHACVLAARGDAEVLYPLLERGLIAPADVPSGDPWRGLAVLAHPDAGPGWFDRLAADPDPVLRCELSARFPLPARIVERLLTDPDLDVVTSAARCQSLSEELAVRLASDARPVVRRAVAANEHTPPDVLLRLLPDPDPQVMHLLAGNPAMPPDVLRHLVGGRSVRAGQLTRWKLASRTDLADDVYAVLAEDDLPGVRRDLAANPAAVALLPRLLARDRSREIRQRAAVNPLIPLTSLVRLAAETKIGAGLVPRVATATEAELRILAGAPAAQVRRLAAAREDLPSDLLERFTADPDAGVAKAVAANPRLGPAQLRTLARHGSPVHARLAANPRCPGDLARRMLGGASVRTLRELARQPGLAPESIVELLGHADDRVVTAAAANPGLPVAAMADLADEFFPSGV
ncbi:hypothetical protein ACGFMK_35745 [Amycolatopsis sp. NPDC049252]|uniref:variant leucine-rich repeat-containing protein n=1 Tax=Amycolatopsis sp. NPDC049252 TaxID=3363933 RepID=UPI00371DB2EB